MAKRMMTMATATVMTMAKRMMIMAKRMMTMASAMVMAMAKRMMTMATAMAGGSLQPLLLP